MMVDSLSAQGSDASLRTSGPRGCVLWSWQCSINREWCNANTPLHGVRFGGSGLAFGVRYSSEPWQQEDYVVC